MENEWFTLEMKACLVGVLLLFLMGCGTSPDVGATAEPQTPNAAKVDYRKDLEIEVNGIKGVGMLAVPRATSYQINAKAPSDPEQVVFATCNRDEPMGKQDDRFKIKFDPIAPELRGHCMAEIMALGQKFEYSGALIEVADQLSLPGQVFCNGKVTAAQGAAVCQSAEGRFQEIHFAVPVDYVPQISACPSAEPLLEDKQFQIVLGRGLCVYNFQERTFPFRVMRLTTHGYTRFRTGAK